MSQGGYMSEWIIAEKAKPGPLDEEVLCLDSSGTKHLCLWDGKDWKEWGPDMFESMGWIKVANILYWLPIPEPPKDKPDPMILEDNLAAIQG
jgi:hypothetical protein